MVGTLTLTPVELTAASLSATAEVGPLRVVSRKAVRSHIGNVETPAGARSLEADDSGNVWAGPNRLVVADRDKSIPDFLWDAALRWLFARSLSLRNLGDPPDLVLGRAGDNIYPEGSWPDVSDWGIRAGQSLGAVRWFGWHASNNRGSEGWRRSSAVIYARATEDLRYDSPGPTVASGGELRFQTCPAGGEVRDAVVVRGDGTLQALFNVRLRSVGGRTPSGGADGDVVKGDGCLWVNDLGSWRSIPLGN